MIADFDQLHYGLAGIFLLCNIKNCNGYGLVTLNSLVNFIGVLIEQIREEKSLAKSSWVPDNRSRIFIMWTPDTLTSYKPWFIKVSNS